MKKIKYIAYLITISIFSLTLQTVFPAISHAVDTTTNTGATTTTTEKPSTTNTTTTTEKPSTTRATTTDSSSTEAAARTQRIQNLKNRANTEIERRITALNSLISKIGALKRLPTDQLSAFKSEIQNNITDLTSLKIKINADTDPTILQTDVKTIVESYRIFALYVPKINLLAAANVAADMATSLNNLMIKMQTRITAEQTSGKDVTSLQAELIGMQAKINDANNQIILVNTTVTPLTPSNFQGSNSSLQNAQQLMKTVRADLQAARLSAQNIINDLKKLQK